MSFLENYSELITSRPFDLRDMLRGAALSGLSLLDRWEGYEKELKKPRVHFLYIHHVFKDEEIRLRNLLEILQRHHTFITYKEAIRRILQNQIDKSYIVFSSDDGLKNNLQAAKILRENGAYACFFINPPIIGQKDPQIIHEFCEKRLIFPDVEFLDWDEVEQIQSLGHEIGSHTMGHIQIAEMPEEQIREDMQATYNIIRQRCGAAEHFAFPYGRFFHFNETGRKACFEAGFKSCASAERGSHVNGRQVISENELCILRDLVVLGWDINHILHFIVKSAKKASFENNFFPYST